MYSVRRWLGSARTLASLFGSFAAESGAVVVGAKRGRTVRCHFQGPRRQTGRRRWCDLHHRGIVRLAQPEREVHHGNASAWCEDPSVFFSLRFMWKAETLVQSHFGVASFQETFIRPLLPRINCSQTGGQVLYGASVIHAINN